MSLSKKTKPPKNYNKINKKSGFKITEKIYQKNFFLTIKKFQCDLHEMGRRKRVREVLDHKDFCSQLELLVARDRAMAEKIIGKNLDKKDIKDLISSGKYFGGSTINNNDTTDDGIGTSTNFNGVPGLTGPVFGLQHLSKTILNLKTIF